MVALAALLALTATAHAAEPDGPPQLDAEQREALFLTGGLEYGGATTVRLGASYAVERTVRLDGAPAGMGYFSVGPSLAIGSPDLRRVTTVAATATGRLSAFGHGGPVGFEAGVGAALGPGGASASRTWARS